MISLKDNIDMFIQRHYCLLTHVQIPGIAKIAGLTDLLVLLLPSPSLKGLLGSEGCGCFAFLCSCLGGGCSRSVLLQCCSLICYLKF